MMTLRNSRTWCVVCALLLVASLSTGSSPLLADEYPVLAEWTQGDDLAVNPLGDELRRLRHLVLLATNEAEPADGYWIGIYPRILDKEAEAKRNKDQPRGVVVSRVLPNSPAAEAKLMTGDLIVAVGDREINYLDELSELVKGSAGKTIALEILREGKALRVEVTPAKSIPRPGMLFFGGKEVEAEHGREGEKREKLEAAWRELRELEFQAQTARDPHDEEADQPRVVVKKRNPFTLREAGDGVKVLIIEEDDNDSTIPVEGLITVVQRGDLVEVSLGSDDGLKVGHVLHVYRKGQPDLGRVQVIETSPDRSAAKILRDARTGEIQKGDRVTIRLKVSDDDDDDDDDKRAGYWIGIYPQNIDRETAEKLKVKPGRGVLVGRVLPESPAAKAKLMDGDIIAAAGNRELGNTEQLADIVQGSEGKSIKLKVRRGDKVLDLEVTPAKVGKRPNMRFFGREGKVEQREKAEQRETAEAREKLEGMLFRIHENQRQAQRAREGGQEGSSATRPVFELSPRPQLPMPGAATNVAFPSGLPDDMHVTIQKRGNLPARVTVTQGVKKWQTTENELGMLPPPALAYVSRLLGRPMMPPGKGGFGVGRFVVPGAGAAGQPRRFEIRTRENGEQYRVEVTGVPEKSPAGSPEGIRIEIKEHGQREGKAPQDGEVKWHELRRPDRPQATPADHLRDMRIHELQEQVRKLQSAVEELSKEKPQPHKKRKKKE